MDEWWLPSSFVAQKRGRSWDDQDIIIGELNNEANAQKVLGRLLRLTLCWTTSPGGSFLGAQSTESDSPGLSEQVGTREVEVFLVGQLHSL